MIATPSRSLPSSSGYFDSNPLVAGAPLPADTFASIRRKLCVQSCKWDPQVGDDSTLAEFPIYISCRTWRWLAQKAEALADELMAMERELVARPDLFKTLGVPRRLRPKLVATQRLGPTPELTRAMRFDFHWTTEGWRISEVNSDVPGGYAEASAFTRMFADECGSVTAGDPARDWADSVASRVPAGSTVAMLSAPGFMEDQQVVSFLAQRLNARGIATYLANPRQIVWRGGNAFLPQSQGLIAVAGIVRFFQAEWLARLPRSAAVLNYFAGGKTPVANVGSSILTESKRLPLVWDKLQSTCRTWQELLPETRDPRSTPWQLDDRWLIKSAYCNTGDTVSAHDLVPAKQWLAARRWAHWLPGGWIAQRRFTPIGIKTPRGEMFPCIGVYTIDGMAAGIYARLSHTPVVNFRAIDAACLIAPDAEIRMTPEDIYEAWAPSGALWSRWVKPVVFAHLPKDVMPPHPSLTQFGPPELNIDWVPRSDGSAAIVVDLPSAHGTYFGLALAGRGFRPVPLYNSVPSPTQAIPTTFAHLTVVEMSAIVEALIAGVSMLVAERLPYEAPPAFLLDSRRREGSGPSALVPHAFDNRSISLPTDFPSANFLLANGIARVIVINDKPPGAQPNADLSHTLLRWQDAGIEVHAFSVAGGTTTMPLVVEKPKWYGSLVHGLLSRMGLRRHILGGYGGVIPEPSSSSGG